jgi:hypothetical protein
VVDIGQIPAKHDRKESVMNKMLLAVFDNETAAFEGLKALKALHDDGDITLYSRSPEIRPGRLSLKNKTIAGPSAPRLGCLRVV